MVVLIWDASGLAKRYAPELGSDVVDALFAAVPAAQFVSSTVAYAEVYSLLLRKLNRGAISRAIFAQAKSNLLADLIRNPDVTLLRITDGAFYDGVALMERHNINSTDAALLVLFLAYAQSFASDLTVQVVLVAADARLIRAAQIERIPTINPETVLAGEVPALLANL